MLEFPIQQQTWLILVIGNKKKSYCRSHVVDTEPCNIPLPILQPISKPISGLCGPSPGVYCSQDLFCFRLMEILCLLQVLDVVQYSTVAPSEVKLMIMMYMIDVHRQWSPEVKNPSLAAQFLAQTPILLISSCMASCNLIPLILSNLICKLEK